MTESESQFVEGLIVAPRKWKPIENRGRKSLKGLRTGWTLHRDDCPHAARKHPSDLMPAPRQAYPDTTDCPLCKPNDPHHVTWKDLGDGKVQASCTACDLTATGNSSGSVLSTMNRRHQAQRATEALAAAIASGDAPTRVVTRRRSGGADAWMLHRPDCGYAVRAKGVLPAPTPLAASTQSCMYCRPDDEERHRTACQNVDGALLATCSGCDLTATAGTVKSAWAALKRRHDLAADRAALEAAVVAGERPTLLVTRRRQKSAAGDASAMGWTLHHARCWQLRRALGARPAPNPPEPNTTPCTFCQPEQAQSPPAQAVA